MNVFNVIVKVIGVVYNLIKVYEFIITHKTIQQRSKSMSRLTDKFSLMKNMNEDELRKYIKNNLTDNEKNIMIFSFMKMHFEHDDVKGVFSKIEE